MIRKIFNYLGSIAQSYGRNLQKHRPSRWDISSHQKYIVVFSGGIGAQIMSAATYWYLQEQGKEVKADMSYFHERPFETRPTMVGGISYWPWNLDFLGIPQDSFLQSHNLVSDGSHFFTVGDNFQKFEIALKALATPSIKVKFKSGDFEGSIKRCLPIEFGDQKGYAAIHIRRGDYLNVASHIVSDRTFISTLESVSRILDRCVLISDSPIPLGLRKQAQIKFETVVFLDSPNILETDAHLVMQQAKFLVTSNSQYSLTAALLGHGVSVVPKVWFSGEPGFSKAINGLGDYQLLTQIL